MEVVNFLLTLMYKVATIFLFLFLFSCTVTKRVHRPGFHIEWKKNYRVQAESESERQVSSGVEMQDLHEDIGEGEMAETNEISAEFDVRFEKREGRASRASAREVNKSQREKKLRKSIDIKQEARSFFMKKSRKYALKIPKQKKKASRVSNESFGEGFLYLGYVLLGIGGYILIGALLSFFGFWIMEELFYSLVFSGNGFIAGILGFLLFVFIFVVVIIAYLIVRYLLGGAYLGFIVSTVFIAAGLLCLLIYSFT